MKKIFNYRVYFNGKKGIFVFVCAMMLFCNHHVYASPPTVTMGAVYSIGSSTAVGNAWLGDTGGESTTAYIVWGTNSGSYTSSCSAGVIPAGGYSCSITGLAPNTKYYANAYVSNASGGVYGTQISFTTTATTATVTTSAVSSIGATTATGNGYVHATGGNNPTRYIQWGTTSGSYTASCSAGVGSIGAYACAMTGLLPNTTYYVRAYATNSAGTSYGTQTSFTTSATTPIVNTQETTLISATTAIGNGDVTATGGANPTARGMQWGMVSDNYTSSCSAGSGGVGTYSCSMTELMPNTTYYVRAYAINSAGTSYGTQTSFTTFAAIPITSTQIPLSITTTTAAGNGNITDTGGEDPTRYIEWGTTSGTYTDQCSAGIGGTGTYTCGITNLQPNTTYYVRAKATNSAGTSYGNELSFTTTVGMPAVTTNAATNITPTQAVLNATVTAIGGENPTRKILWGTEENALTNFCDKGVGAMGMYSCTLSNLTPNTTYYIKAQVTNTAGTESGDTLSFTTIAIPAEITIPDPNVEKIENATNNAYFTIQQGTQTNTQEVKTNTTVKLTTTNTEVTLPPNTTITENNNNSFDFTQFHTTNTTQTIKTHVKESLAAVKIGVPNTQMHFSNLITLTLFVGDAYNTKEMQVLYQEDGETTWNPFTTCVISNGLCTFQTDHATTYTVNGDGTISGAGQNDITTDVQDVLSLDCDQTGNTNDNIVEFGNLTPGTPVTASTTCTVTTNSDAGYTLAVKREDTTSTMDKDGDETTDIADRTPWDAIGTGNAQTWNLNDANLAFTVYSTNATKNESWWGTGTTVTDANNKYAGFPTNYTDIMQHTEYDETATVTNIGYKLDVPTTQKSGIYSGDITYQVVTAP